uniref:Putative secreted protein n=1 Tax=Anopheles triannulatus TaxID=58253 RepID=A0A2M4B4B2_9DIPT
MTAFAPISKQLFATPSLRGSFLLLISLLVGSAPTTTSTRVHIKTFQTIGRTLAGWSRIPKSLATCVATLRSHQRPSSSLL